MKCRNQKLLGIILLVLAFCFAFQAANARAETWKEYYNEAKTLEKSMKTAEEKIKKLEKEREDLIAQKVIREGNNVNANDLRYMIDKVEQQLFEQKELVKSCSKGMKEKLAKARDTAERDKDWNGCLQVGRYQNDVLGKDEAVKCFRSAERISLEKRDEKGMRETAKAYSSTGQNFLADQCQVKADALSGSDTWKKHYDEAVKLKQMNKKSKAGNALNNAEWIAAYWKNKSAMLEIAKLYDEIGYPKSAARCRQKAASY